MTVLVLAGAAVAIAAVFLLLSGRAHTTADARIHVDDLVVGAGPPICAITGAPTTHRVHVSSTEGGAQGWWFLLVLLGPPGWVGLVLLVALARRPGRVSGTLAISPEALDQYNRTVALSRWALGAAVAVLAAWALLVAATDDLDPVLVGIGTGALVAGLVVWVGATVAAPFRWIDLELDGSGRWVTIRRAHPDLAVALQRHNAETHARRPVSP